MTGLLCQYQLILVIFLIEYGGQMASPPHTAELVYF